MYVNTPVYRVGGDVVFGLRQPAMYVSSNDLMVSVPLQLEGRLDLVSNMLYGSPDFWWAIADLNALVDPFLVPAGSQLRTGPRQNLPT